MKRLLRRLLPSLPLSLAVFTTGLLLSERIGAGQVALALGLALGLPHLAGRLEREFARIGSLRPVSRLLAVMLYDIVRCNLRVALQVLGPRSAIHPGWIWIPLELTNIHGITALASLITLTPGTVSAELSDDRRYLLVHVLDMRDPETEIAEIKARYEAPLKEIFP